MTPKILLRVEFRNIILNLTKTHEANSKLAENVKYFPNTKEENILYIKA